jgi:hypothetical protein
MKFFARFFSKKRRLLADTPRCRMPPAGEITPPVLLAAKHNRQ